MLGFLAAIKGAIKTLDDRWSATRQGYLDRLNTDYTTGLKDNLVTTNSRIDKAMSTRLRAPVCTTYTSGSGNYNTRHTNSLIFAILVAGGGGGGCSSATNRGAGGGGGGQTLMRWFRANGATIDYIVGAGGTGGTSSIGWGGKGGTTKLGFLRADGGSGGWGDGYTDENIPGGFGGGCQWGWIDNNQLAAQTIVDPSGIPGGAGGRGHYSATADKSKGGFVAGFPLPRDLHSGAANGQGIPPLGSTAPDYGGGGGGSSMYGDGQTGGTAGAGVPSAPSGYGGGGAGSSSTGSSVNGGAGAGGLILIYDYGNVDDGN